MAKATRQAFGEALAALGATHSEIVVLDADLSKSTKSDLFAKKFPERFYEMGIAEANMIGTAAGMAFAGKLPFLCSFGAFITGRYDTIRLSVAYAQANVRMIGTHAGVGIGDDGHSQMGLEDLTLMRALPQVAVFQPVDAIETEKLMKYLVETHVGPAYIRLTRQALPELTTAESKFEPGKLLQIGSVSQTASSATASKTPGAVLNSVAIIGSGATVAEAVGAQKILKEKGIEAEVWNAHTIKPFDGDMTRKIAGRVKLIVTVEDHTVMGGLGSCVSEALSILPHHARQLTLGVQDLFGESGEGPELYEKHGISAGEIAESVLSTLNQ